MTDEAPAQGTPPQDQQAPPAPVAPPAAPAAPVAAPHAPGPWANDLASTFADEAERARVDAFLRSKVQPYTTQLEQQAASLKDAERLYSDLSNSPIDTYVAITNEMFGEQAANDMLALLQNEQAQQTTPAAEGQQPQAASDPRLQSVISYVEQRQQQEYYDGELARIQQAHPEVVPAHLAPFVAAAQGDFDQAYETYTTWLRDVTQTNTPPPPVSEAPAVLTGDGSAPTPPVAPKKQSLDEAIADFMAEQRPNAAPPVVGGV